MPRLPLFIYFFNNSPLRRRFPPSQIELWLCAAAALMLAKNSFRHVGCDALCMSEIDLQRAQKKELQAATDNKSAALDASGRFSLART
jgi:hypothetical protein